MTLRPRLLLTSVSVAIPLALMLFFVNERLRLRDMEQDLRRSIEGEFARAGSCEVAPELFGFFRPPPEDGGGRRGGPPGRGAGPNQLFVYSRAFYGARGRGPEVPDALRAALLRGDVSATSTFWTMDGRGIAVGVPFGAQDGPCAFLIGWMPPRPGVLHDQLMAFGLVIISVVGAAWFAAGPVIGRLRRLGEHVRQSADAYYAAPVPVPDSGRDEVSSLARAFNTAGAHVREHLLDLHARRESLRHFVGNTSHDIALPLTVLQGHLAELERLVPAGSPQQTRVREAVQEAHYMASLLRNLSAAATLDEEASVPFAPVDVSALVERVAARHRALARARGVTLEHAVPEHEVHAMGDVTLFEQAVSNLVENAIHYNRDGGHVALVLDRRSSDRFVVRVVDDGPGVSPEDLAVFTTRRFRGSDARTRRPEGQGLGLSIVAEAVARLGFTLEFHRPDAGGLAAEIAGLCST
jgi:signal transduction histidine kinase